MKVLRWDELSLDEKEALVEGHNHGGSSEWISVLEPIVSGKLPWDYVAELDQEGNLILDGFSRPLGGERGSIKRNLGKYLLVQIG